MQADRLQLQRFELKYVVTEDVALGARDFVRSYLSLDENGTGKPNNAYAVHSIYLDSDDLTLFRQTVNGNKNRYKLRIRFYDDSPESPVFLEIKRRANNAILKQRCAVHQAGVNRVLAGQMPSPNHILSREPKHLTALQNFIQYIATERAKPKAHVGYYREAWISPSDNSVRVTMDRDTQFDAEPSARFCRKMNQPVRVFGSQVILEIKFTGRFPTWFGELVRIFGLAQRSAAKYADGVTAFGEHKLQSICLTAEAKPLESKSPAQTPQPNLKEVA